MKASSLAKKMLRSFTPEVQEYFAALDEKLANDGITLFLSSGTNVNKGNGRCSGYFDSFYRVLAVALNRSEEKVLCCALHEEGHWHQYLDKTSVWYSEYEDSNNFWLWLKGSYFTNPKKLMIALLKIEHDCERRTLLEIEKNWNHIVDCKRYAMAANAYCCAHYHMLENRSWLRKSPCVPKILAHSPTELVPIDEYPENLLAAIKKFL